MIGGIVTRTELEMGCPVQGGDRATRTAMGFAVPIIVFSTGMVMAALPYCACATA